MKTKVVPTTIIPIYLDHKRTPENVVGLIKIVNGVMLIEFFDGHEPTHDKMQDLFGCAAGNILKYAERDGKIDKTRIKLFKVLSWGYK